MLFYSEKDKPPKNWKSHKHPRKIKLDRPYSKGESALSLVSKKTCEKLKCQNDGKKKYMVEGHAHYLIYLNSNQRRRLKKRKYTRAITDDGQELYAKDRGGHMRRLRSW